MCCNVFDQTNFKLRSLNVRFISRKLTIQDGLERCLKKGKGEEQAQAAFCLVLLCVQMGAGNESEEIFKQLRSMLTTVLSDSSASLKARTAVSPIYASSLCTALKLLMCQQVINGHERLLCNFLFPKVISGISNYNFRAFWTTPFM